MTEHTPLPWKQSASVIWSEEGKQVVCAVCEPEPKSGNVLYEKLQIGSKNFDTAIANAAFIVRACNSHADLLEAFEAINAVFITHTNDQINIDWIRSKVGQAIEKAKEVNGE